jgi:hypothetical protein
MFGCLGIIVERMTLQLRSLGHVKVRDTASYRYNASEIS